MEEETNQLNEMQKELEISGYSFIFVDIIQLERDNDGKIIIDMPQERYNNINGYSLNKYGKSPFCKFKIDEKWNYKKGVYLLVVDSNIKYVGECENLYQRINWGYGNISPRNCFKGGQSTNCKINNLILQTYKNNQKVFIYFLETSDRFNIEGELRLKLNPPWNAR